MERAWELAEYYKSLGVITLGGSWHAHYLPEETLRHNIDLVVHGDADLGILKVFAKIDNPAFCMKALEAFRIWTAKRYGTFCQTFKMLAK